MVTYEFGRAGSTLSRSGSELSQNPSTRASKGDAAITPNAKSTHHLLKRLTRDLKAR